MGRICNPRVTSNIPLLFQPPFQPKSPTPTFSIGITPHRHSGHAKPTHGPIRPRQVSLWPPRVSTCRRRTHGSPRHGVHNAMDCRVAVVVGSAVRGCGAQCRRARRSGVYVDRKDDVRRSRASARAPCRTMALHITDFHGRGTISDMTATQSPCRHLAPRLFVSLRASSRDAVAAKDDAGKR